jgi:formylmethanofuran dehydrogenase subunit E
MAKLDDLLGRTAALHDHLCPRQVLGVRMGMYAADLLELNLPQSDKRLFAFVETDGCFADGVSVATNCWLGRRTMRLLDEGKIAATFVDTHTERALRIRPRLDARSRATAYAPAASSRWHAYLEAYQCMPATELFDVQPIVLTVSLAAIISQPGVRITCARCGEEVLNEREVRQHGQPLCRTCAEGTYYEVVERACER